MAAGECYWEKEKERKRGAARGRRRDEEGKGGWDELG